jgi:hypothetical protein
VLGAVLLLTTLGCGNIFQMQVGNMQPYRVALMVSDLEGTPLADAAVWIDNELMENKSTAAYSPLGDGFPTDWSGWPANYISPILNTRIESKAGVNHIEIIVGKSGYRVSRVSFDVTDITGTDYYRAAVPLEPAL